MRWPLVLPAAVVGYLVMQIVVFLVTAFIPIDLVARLAGSYASPVGFVLLGTRVAPRAKVQTAWVLAALIVGLTLPVLALSTQLDDPRYGNGELVATALLTLLGAAGAVLFATRGHFRTDRGTA